MGMFKKEVNDGVLIPHIKPSIIRTSNVAKELLQFSSNYKVPVNSLDFHLLDTQTFTKTGDNNSDDWIELSADEIKDLSEADFLNPKFYLKQVHEIEIFSITETHPLDMIDISIGGNSTLCKIYLTIKVGSFANYDETFQNDFIHVINKKKLRANVMIGIFDSMMFQNLSEFFSKIRMQEEYHFESQERYLIAESYEPVETVNDQLILHYDVKRKSMDERGRIDYSKRGYIISAVKNELLIEYIKPRKGDNGRNCRGEFIAPKEPIIKYEPTFKIGEKIIMVDTPSSIEYRAAAGGYVTFEGDVYDIKTEVEVTEISFRTTGSIETQLDADVSLNVKEKDVLKDAIGQGMEVTVHAINIDGNIGPNAKVTAKKATVEGQVHQSATISADELSINIHKGTAYGKNVHITRLEQGSVDAERVTVMQATGGKIRAKEIIIEMLGSHVKMTASHRIEIKKIHGGENQFVIDPMINESIENIEKQSQQMVLVKQSIRDIQKELTAYEKIWHENIPAMEEIKHKLLHYKNNGIKMPVAFVQKYQKNQQFKEKLDSLRAELTAKEELYAWLNEKHTTLQSEIFEARIINHDVWRNYNEIIFKLIDPPIDVLYVPTHNTQERILGLHKDEDGEFSIRVLEQ